ncbi:MAG: Flp pilus assembly protein CpaB [Clostridiaceae bacterium]
MEKANKKIIIIALLLALATAVLVYVYISGQKAPAPKIEYATVYVAAKTMPARYKITNADIMQVNIAKELLNANAVSDINEIVGKRLKESIIQGEQIRKERLVDEDKASLSFNLPEGTRAVSMNVNEQVEVAGLIRPGDFVDILVSFEKEEENNGQITKVFPRITKTILQNVEVLALGQDLSLPPDKIQELPSTITLAVKKEDVELFVYASEYGSLRLALRPADDGEIISTQGILRSDMTGTKGVYTRSSDITN